MNKCSFCDHCSFTDKGEKVCTKYLVYIGRGPHTYCGGPEFSVPLSRIVIIAGVIAAILLSIIFSQL